MRLEAQFISSAFALSDAPRWLRVEVALAGRSNVGKSSLLNALAGAKGLARTSKTPGRTRCVNFFAVGTNLALVDLPGFGYAKMARTDAVKIAAMLREYLEYRENLGALVMLADARRGPEREELELAAMVRARGCEIIAVATKFDKIRNAGRAEARKRFAALSDDPIMCSVLDGAGLDQLRGRILACARDSGGARRLRAFGAE
ncbi:MAG TPA: ribosome biogenesis GTP-binding protein YihA/YsxC [Candidatus Binataceae bacterium]|nr:ribosome biogenesis GTP-binding protein YihA/YsxC [Candidatus Binataceae bacterium]